MSNDINIRSGYYGLYLGVERRLYGTSSGWIVAVEKSGGVKELIYKYKNKEAKRIIESAYSVITFCNYQKGLYSIDYISEDEVRLNPDLDTLTEILGKHPYSHGLFKLTMPHSEFFKEDLEIWEKRKKVSGFRFKVDKIKYIKER